MLLVVGIIPAIAQWSVRVDEGKSPKDMYAVDDPRINLPDHLFQPFTEEEWEASNYASPTDIASFEDLRYGMFIHFGLSTYQGKDLSWGTVKSIKWPDKRPDGYTAPPGPIQDEYLQWPAQMRLEKFDAKRWVQLARDCGFRYITVIAKHHEGFHMFDTAHSDFKITRTPFGRDYLKEIAEACQASGMPFGIYYAQREWHHPDYDPKNPRGKRHQRYLDYNRKVCRELCTRYGKLDIFWFDALWWGGMFTADMWEAESLTRMIRQLQPNVVINNRASLPGDFDTPEQRSGYYQERAWEACLSLTDTWSWTGSPPKTRDHMVRIIASTACANGNVLVSWGPHWDGAFDEMEVRRLREVGEWLETYGSSIYGTRGGPWLPATWGGSTRAGKRVYLHVLNPDLSSLQLPVIPARVESAFMLKRNVPVKYEQSATGIQLEIPRSGRDPADTVVVLELNQPVKVTIRSGSTGSPFDDPVAYGRLLLSRTDMKIDGASGVLDTKRIRKITAVSVKPNGDSTPLKLSLSRDGREWIPIASVGKSPKHWQVSIKNPAAGTLLPGREARYVKIECPGTTDSPTLERVQIYGF